LADTTSFYIHLRFFWQTQWQTTSTSSILFILASPTNYMYRI